MKKKLHHAWIIMLSCWMLYLSVALIRFVYPYLVPTMEATLGISHTVMATILSLYFWADAIMRIVWGVLSDKIGARLTAFIGALILASGIFVMSLGRTVVMLTLGFGLAGVGAAALFILPTQVLSRWFGKGKRGMATGISQTGTSAITLTSGLIIPVVLLTFTYDQVWRVEAIALFGIAILLFFMLRNKPADMGLSPLGATPEEIEAAAAQPVKRASPWSKESLKQVFGNPSFYLILAAYFMFGFANTGFVTFRMSYLMQEGWEAVQLGRLISITSVVALFGPPLFGTLGDKIEKRKIYAGTMVLSSVAMVILLFFAKSMVGLMGGLVLLAIVGGAPVVMNASIMPEYFPMSLLGTSFGLIAGFFSVASAISPIVGGMIADATGSLNGVVVISITAYLLGAVCMLILKKKSSTAQKTSAAKS